MLEQKECISYVYTTKQKHSQEMFHNGLSEVLAIQGVHIEELRE